MPDKTHAKAPTEKAVFSSTASSNSVQPKLNAHAELPATRNSEPLIALRPVRLTLELIAATHGGATAVAHSGLDHENGARIIRGGLCSRHLLVDRALRRADGPDEVHRNQIARIEIGEQISTAEASKEARSFAVGR